MAVDMTVGAKPKQRGRPRKPAAGPEPEPVAVALTPAVSSITAVAANSSIPELWGALPADQWQRVLDTQPIDSPGGKLAAVRTDPRWRDLSLERQCAEAGVSAVELARMVSDLALSTALIASSKHIADVVNGVGESAKPLIVTCDLCLGLRDGDGQPTTIEVAHPRDAAAKLKIDCPKCGGIGRTRRDANPRAVETFLKLHGGLEEQQGPAIQLNQQFNFGSQHAIGVHRGQELLERGRSKRSAPSAATATVIDVEPSA